MCGIDLKRVVSICVVAGLGASSFGIVRLDGVTDATYQAFGANSFFNAIGKVNGGGGTGTLVAKDWVLTAAHVVNGGGSHTFTIGGNTYTSDQRILRDAGWTLENGMDLALLHLSTDVVGIDPMAIYGYTDEIGQEAVGVGFGLTGTGSTGATGGAGTKRAGTNIIDGTVDFGSGEVSSIIIADFDSGQEADNFSGSASPTGMEFNVAPGDSGGALTIFRNGRYELAGVTSFYASVDGLTNGDYGDISGWVRTSSHLDWLNSTAGVPEPGTMALLATGAAALVARKRKKA